MVAWGDNRCPHRPPAVVPRAQAVVDQEFVEVSMSQYRGKYVVLFFYPLDFTFVCPTEITAVSSRLGRRMAAWGDKR